MIETKWKKIRKIFFFLIGLGPAPLWGAKPSPWACYPSVALAKKQFIAKIAAYAKEENLIILEARKKVCLLEKKKNLTVEEKKYLQKLLAVYRASSLSSLKERMDVVPVSLTLAQGIEESGWGQSSRAREKNSCFGMSKNGRCISFESLKACVVAYIHNFNKNPAYRQFRSIRRELRDRNVPLRGSLLVQGLRPYCPYPSYPKKIRFIIVRYNLEKFDCKPLI